MPEPSQRFQEPRRSELRAVVGCQRHVRLAASLRAADAVPLAPPLPAHLPFGNGSRDPSPRSPACSSRSRSPGKPSPLQAPPRSSSCPIARSDSARRLPPGPTLSSVVLANDASAPATLVPHHPQYSFTIHRQPFLPPQPPSHSPIAVGWLLPTSHYDLFIVSSVRPAASRLLLVIQARPADG